MKNFTNNYGEEQFYSFFTLDMPIHTKQLETLRDEIEYYLQHHGDAVDRWVWDTCEGVDHDGYGSFRFEWPAEVMNFLTEEQKQRMEEIVNEIVGSTDIVCSMCDVHSFSEGGREINDEYDVEDYMNTIINAGYSLCKDDADIVPDHLQDAFNTYYATLKITEEMA
jgi:hypothetical protein